MHILNNAIIDVSYFSTVKKTSGTNSLHKSKLYMSDNSARANDSLKYLVIMIQLNGFVITTKKY